MKKPQKSPNNHQNFRERFKTYKNPSELLKPGMNVSVWLKTAQNDKERLRIFMNLLEHMRTAQTNPKRQRTHLNVQESFRVTHNWWKCLRWPQKTPERQITSQPKKKHQIVTKHLRMSQNTSEPSGTPYNAEHQRTSHNIQDCFKTAQNPWERHTELYRMPQNLQQCFLTIQNQWEHFKMRQSTTEHLRMPQNHW